MSFFLIRCSTARDEREWGEGDSLMVCPSTYERCSEARRHETGHEEDSN